MPHRPLLSRIRRLLIVEPDIHFDNIEQAFRSGKLRPPARPMSDQELARAIREFKAFPASEWTISKLDRRFQDE